MIPHSPAVSLQSMAVDTRAAARSSPGDGDCGVGEGRSIDGGVTPLPRLHRSIFRDVCVRFLTELSICRLSIRFLPPEIACLKNLVKLDLSFNKLRHMPESICGLTSLKSLTAANNKLVDLPSHMYNLQRLRSLDLSNNKLTSVTAIDLANMPGLQFLQLQGNRIYDGSQSSSSMCPIFKGQRVNLIENESFRQSEMELFNTDISSVACINYCSARINDKLHESHRVLKGYKHHDSLQMKARQERLNCCRSSIQSIGKGQSKYVTANGTYISREDGNERPELGHNMTEALADAFKTTLHSLHSRLDTTEGSSVQMINTCESSSPGGFKNCSKNRDFDDIKSVCSTSSSCVSTEVSEAKNDKFDDEADSSSVGCVANQNKFDYISSRNAPGITTRSKRHGDEDLNNPKPKKCRKPASECSDISFKYKSESFCSSDDRIPDGFYDAGRDRPFLLLQNYDGYQFLDSREVILLDRRCDEELDGILLSARLLLSRLKTFCDSPVKEQLAANNFQRASVLALFVSDIFGGSDRSVSLAKIRKAASGSNKEQPFVCTCSAISNSTNKQVHQGYTLADLCEKSLRLIKETHNSSIIPIGALRLGICRHRALLMKYLCDRMDPPIPCELVRGYLDFMPHAWNVVLVQTDQSWIRMVVDACYPTDIRVEMDPEYFCRYIPLSRCLLPCCPDGHLVGCSFPLISLDPEIDNESCRTVRRCRLGTVDVAVKIRHLDFTNVSSTNVKMFEYSFLGEVRILGALRKHKCIVEIYGHQLSKYIASSEGLDERHCIGSMIIMEYINGGSLKTYLEELSLKGAKHVPIDLTMHIAKNVAHALVEVHSKCIIHRDIKSENVLIDLKTKRIDGSPVVKLADFDRAVPLNSSSHTCCIAHVGVHPPDVCVGTPRWMAPEVLRAINMRSPYGLEADIWSYGCLLCELLTLKIPFHGFSESEIYNLLQMGQRPVLAPELEELIFDRQNRRCDNFSATYTPNEKRMLSLLIQLFYQCTSCHPADRPTAKQIYNLICEFAPATEV